MKKGNLSTEIDDIYFGEFDKRIQNCLYHYRVETLRQLVAYSRADILKMRNMGAISRAAIENWLEARGLHLGMTEEEIAEYEGVPAKAEEEQAAAEVEHPMIKTEETPSPTEEEVLEKAVKEASQNQGINLEHEVFLLAKEIFLRRMRNNDFPTEFIAMRSAQVAIDLYKSVKAGLKKLKE